VIFNFDDVDLTLILDRVDGFGDVGPIVILNGFEKVPAI
jgi:hypothetical protein